MVSKLLDTVIIGGGPAGIAALHALKDLDVVLVEKGQYIDYRKHNENSDLNIGIGGAGLFSDGKFSYYPSGTNLYKLNRKNDLKKAYSKIIKILNECNIEGIPYPNLSMMSEREDILKTYPSFYGGILERIELINKLVKNSREQISCLTEVIEIEKEGLEYTIYCKKNGRDISFKTRSIILCTGKFTFNSFLQQKNLRYDIGIRIETKHDISLFNKSKYPDIKLIWFEENKEIRTFCTCKRGEVWGLEYEDFSSLSGRSDGRCTDYSNFGFLIRYKGASFDRGNEIYNKMIKNLDNKIYYDSLDGFINGEFKTNSAILNNRPWFPKNKFEHKSLKDFIPINLYKDLRTGLNYLIKEVPDIVNEETFCLYPAIEGMGIYYEHNDLKIPNENIWVCGDISGDFRGIIPALVSGVYVGDYVNKELSKEKLYQYVK